MVTQAQPLMGFEGYIYVGEAGSETLTEDKRVTNLRCGHSFSEVDTTIQGNHGHRSYSKGLEDSVMAWDQVIFDEMDEPSALVDRATHNRKYPIALKVIEKESGRGFVGTFNLFGGDTTMTQDGMQATPITARPATGYDPPTRINNESGNES